MQKILVDIIKLDVFFYEEIDQFFFFILFEVILCEIKGCWNVVIS